MSILAHAAVQAEHRLDLADTANITLHPRWCSQDDCEQPWGDMFHTRTVAELVVADADLIDTPATLDIWLEQIDDAVPQVQLVITPLGGSTQRTALTAAQAVAIASQLLLAAKAVAA